MRNEIDWVFSPNISLSLFRYFLLRRSFPSTVSYSVDVFLSITKSQYLHMGERVWNHFLFVSTDIRTSLKTFSFCFYRSEKEFEKNFFLFLSIARRIANIFFLFVPMGKGIWKYFLFFLLFLRMGRMKEFENLFFMFLPMGPMGEWVWKPLLSISTEDRWEEFENFFFFSVSTDRRCLKTFSFCFYR